eukprot:2403680-Pyramimonas_sp.AAC.1
MKKNWGGRCTGHATGRRTLPTAAWPPTRVPCPGTAEDTTRDAQDTRVPLIWHGRPADLGL